MGTRIKTDKGKKRRKGCREKLFVFILATTSIVTAIWYVHDNKEERNAR